MSRNRHGLSRDIPEKTQRKVRERCGFGCVMCGLMIYQYEHFAPPFKDCKVHNPEGITLLCGSCHDKKTRGFLSQHEVVKANSNPHAKHNGYWEKLRYDITPPIIFLGNNSSHHFKDIIIINDKKIITIDSPETKNSPYRITASFFDMNNKLILSINKNVISGKPSDVDIVAEGGIIMIKSLTLPIVNFLRISLKKHPHQFEILELNMIYQGNQVTIDEQGNLIVKNSHGGGCRFDNSSFTARPSSNTFCLKISPCGKIQGFGYN